MKSAMRFHDALVVLLFWLTFPAGAWAQDRAEDRAAIVEMTYCYAYAVDILGNAGVHEGADAGLASATAKFKQCLTDDAKLQLFFQGKEGKATPAGSGGPSAFAQFVRTYFTAYRYSATQHIVGNVSITFTAPNKANVVSYIQANHWLDDGRLLIVPVRYEDEAVREDGGWRIAKRDIIANLFWVTQGYYPNPVDPKLSRAAP
jgi:SnoaL-like protein